MSKPKSTTSGLRKKERKAQQGVAAAIVAVTGSSKRWVKKVENIAARDRQLPFTVPAGYFDSLRERVMLRCGEPMVAPQKRLSLWNTIRPQLAFAAGFALLVGIATLVVKFTATPSPNNANEIAVASYISAFDIQAYEEYADVLNNAVNEDAIVDYLLHDSSINFLAMSN